MEVAALSPRREGGEEDYQGTRLVRLPSSISRLPGTCAGLVKMMSRSPLDTVFMLSGGASAVGVILLSFAKLTGRRSGVFFYGRDILQARRSVLGKLALLISVLLADGVGANSRYTARLIPLRRGTPVVIIYPGTEERIAEDAESVEKDTQAPRVLFVGRLVERKGADVLLRAFAETKVELPALRLDIVGDGPEKTRLVALAQNLGLGNAVTFHGALYGGELHQMYARSSLFVMPAKESAYDVEGFGTVFLEAAAFGVPSIGTLTGGIPEAIVDGVTGRLVKGGDAGELALAMRELLEDPEELARLGAGARERASDLTWEASTECVLRMLGEAV